MKYMHKKKCWLLVFLPSPRSQGVINKKNKKTHTHQTMFNYFSQLYLIPSWLFHIGLEKKTKKKNNSTMVLFSCHTLLSVVSGVVYHQQLMTARFIAGYLALSQPCQSEFEPYFTYHCFLWRERERERKKGLISHYWWKFLFRKNAKFSLPHISWVIYTSQFYFSMKEHIVCF